MLRYCLCWCINVSGCERCVWDRLEASRVKIKATYWTVVTDITTMIIASDDRGRPRLKSVAHIMQITIIIIVVLSIIIAICWAAWRDVWLHLCIFLQFLETKASIYGKFWADINNQLTNSVKNYNTTEPAIMIVYGNYLIIKLYNKKIYLLFDLWLSLLFLNLNFVYGFYFLSNSLNILATWLINVCSIKLKM